MIKNILPTDPITGEFRHLYAEGITFDVEHDGNTYPFLEWEQAIEFYNKL
jgi:hypothetical protein